MTESDPSPLVQGVTWAVSVLAVVISAIVVGIRRAFKNDKAEKAKPVTGEIVMGALIERRLIEDLTKAVLGLDGTARELLEHLREEAEEEQIERRVAEQVERRVGAEVRRIMRREKGQHDDD